MTTTTPEMLDQSKADRRLTDAIHAVVDQIGTGDVKQRIHSIMNAVESVLSELAERDPQYSRMFDEIGIAHVHQASRFFRWARNEAV
jgi:hypothetical protein